MKRIKSSFSERNGSFVKFSQSHFFDGKNINRKLNLRLLLLKLRFLEEKSDLFQKLKVTSGCQEINSRIYINLNYLKLQF